ncbi:MAG TPA: hypothetical protein VGT98_16850, partial [Candidatus Elarobacter sp.]|nr:hypothetical protein [Candidatus Elarobacter sp.]
SVFAKLLPFFGVAASGEERERMRDVARRDAKGPGISVPRGGGCAWPGIERVAARCLDGPYAALVAASARWR